MKKPLPERVRKKVADTLERCPYSFTHLEPLPYEGKGEQLLEALQKKPPDTEEEK